MTERLDVTDGRAVVRPMGSGSDSWTWEASYKDGSGTELGWCLTKRGAKISAINAYRNISRNYKPMKFKWVPA